MELLSRLLRSRQHDAADGLPVLLYHKIAEYAPGAAVKSHYVSPALFRAHMAFLHRGGYRTVGVGEILRYMRGEAVDVERPIAITFDDGYDCVCHNALPALREFGFEAIVFVLAGFIGGVNDWEPERPAVVEPMLTAEHVVEMTAAGVEFGSHAMTHTRLSQLGDSDLRGEMADSKRVLQDIIGREVTAVSYPFGDQDDRVRAFAAQAGYTAGFTVERGVNRAGGDPFAIKRLNIRRHNYVPLFARKLRRAYANAARRD